MPGGVNSPVRAFGAVDGCPVFMQSGSGSRIRDIDGNEYLDFVASWGALLFGHAHAPVVSAVRSAAARGTSFGAPTEAETLLAEKIAALAPSVQKLRLVNSGTEAAMSALRLARAFTGRSDLVKFAGCYHGHADGFLVSAGSGALSFGIPDSAGVPASTAGHTLVAPYNDLYALKRIFAKKSGDIAAVIVEPVAANMGVVSPEPGFLEGLRKLTSKHGAVLIFDEVITGFRLGSGGAQGYFGVIPDITVFGKILGGGLPLGCYGASAKIMACVSPEGPMYQAGTLSGNPIAVAAGLATLKEIEGNTMLYRDLDTKASALEKALKTGLKKSGIPGMVNRTGSMMTLFFTDRLAVRNLEDAKSCDAKRYAAFFHFCLERGVYLPPSQFEAFFISAAHSDADISHASDVFNQALRRL